MRIKAINILLALIFCTQTALACVWITGTKYNGDSISTSGLTGARLLRRYLEKDPRPDGVTMEAELHGATNFNDRSDYAVALMYLGRSKEAVEKLKALETEKPGEYFIAANLGTAYELAGDNENALHWINEGIHRDPKSHEGTEWLHAKILEAKIARQKDPDYFKKHSVLDLDPGQIGDEMTIGGQRFSPKEMTDAIQYQLTERLQFVKPPDQPVASLLFDYAAIEAATKTLESAKKILEMAKEYGYPADKIQPLLDLYDRRIWERKFKHDAFIVLCIAAGVFTLWVLYRKGIFVLSAKDLKKRRHTNP
jgi:tetratricopeptide (TPR) repeat protein